MSEADNATLQKSSKRFRRCSICCFAGTAVFLVLALVMPFVFSHMFWQQIHENVQLTPENVDLWGQYPGKSGLILSRNYTIYNPSNLYQFVFNKEKPVILEQTGFSFQQVQNYTNLKYSKDNTTVAHDCILTFPQFPDSRPLDNQVQFINIAPLGFWHQLKHSDPSVFGLQSLSGLILGLEQQLQQSVFVTALVSTYFPNRTAAISSLRKSLPLPTAATVYENPVFGLSVHPQLWVAAIKDVTSLNKMGQYLGLQPADLVELNKTIAGWYSGLSKALRQYFYQNSTTGFDSRYMVALQFGQSGVTNNPPSLGSVAKSLTICDSNSSCIGFPQLYSFQKHILGVEQPLVFQPQQLMRIFKHGSPSSPIKDQDALFHKGNMMALFNNGALADNNDTNALLAIQSQFKLKSVQHAKVFWQWAKYITYNFTGLSQKGSNLNYLGISGVASQSLYQVFSSVQDMLLPFLIFKLATPTLKLKGYDTCKDLAVLVLNGQRAELLCGQSGFDSLANFRPLLSLCRDRQGPEWQSKKKDGLSSSELMLFCNQFEQFTDQSIAKLTAVYGCSLSPAQSCTSYQLTVMQWTTSAITLNPLPELGLQTVSSLHDWFPEVPAFELGYFQRQFKRDSQISAGQAIRMFDFDHLFSVTVVNLLFTDDFDSITERFAGLSRSGLEVLRDYLRFVVLNVGFGGLTTKKPARSILFGYVDPLLDTLKTQDPAAGGDPSIDSLVHLNQLNGSALQQQFYTGIDNVDLTRYIKTLNGVNYTNLPEQYWDGNETISRLKNPYKEFDYFQGTDSFQNKPDQLAKSNVTFFVTNIYRWGVGEFAGNMDFFGFECQVYVVSKEMMMNQSENPANAKYYQGFRSFFNFTNVMGAPIYVSKKHMLDVDSRFLDAIEVWDQQHSVQRHPNKLLDDTLIIVEPYSGVSFGATINLQANLYLTQDELFPNIQPVMVPVYSIFRSGNLSQHSVQELFGDLKTGISVKPLIIPVLAGFAVVLLLVGLAARHRAVLLAKEIERNHPLLYSLQEQEAQT